VREGEIMSDQASGFDPEALDDPGFKEDSVREEITHPLLVRLGYASSGDSKIIRSKNLSNPFVMIGTTKRAITQIPDYLLSVEDKYRWVRIPTKPAMHSNLKPATRSDLKPAGVPR
jgi:hypothetical protein